MIRPTRIALAVPVGLLAVGFGVTSHGLHAVHLGPGPLRHHRPALHRGRAGAARVGGRRRRRAARAAALAVGPARARVGRRRGRRPDPRCLPLAGTALVTHAPRWAIHERTLGVAHEEVRIPAGGGRELAAWWIPSRNGVAALLVHGSGGSRARVAAHARMLARHGYGVLALDLPGNGESDGHSNGLGDNAQPAITTALDYLQARPGVDRMVGYGVSMGGEVLLEAAARDTRLARGRLRWLGAARGRRQGAAAARNGARGPRRHGSRLAGARRHARRALAHAADRPASPRARSCSSRAAATRPRSRRTASTPAPAARRPGSGSSTASGTSPASGAARPPTRRAPSASSTARSASSRGARGPPRTARAAAS